MKTILITGILLLTTSALLSQVLETNPENIIIEYRNGKKIVRNKNDYKKYSPDSFHFDCRDDFEREFLIKRDNEHVNYSEPRYYFFNPDHSFVSYSGADTLYGKWSYSNQSKGVIRVDYDKPKPVYIPEEIKKHLPPEHLKQLKHMMSEIFFLNDLDNETLVFFTTGPTEQTSVSEELYLRVIKTIYNKVQ